MHNLLYGTWQPECPLCATRCAKCLGYIGDPDGNVTALVELPTARKGGHNVISMKRGCAMVGGALPELRSGPLTQSRGQEGLSRGIEIWTKI